MFYNSFIMPHSIYIRMSAYVVSEIVTILHQNYPINTGLLAEIVAFGATEVVVRPEGFIESGDQVKERLSAALVRERTLPIIQTLTQSESKTYFSECAMTFWKTCIVLCVSEGVPQEKSLTYLLGLIPELCGGDRASSTCGCPS